MSASWSPLVPTAMVGTDRQAAALPAWPGEVGQFMAAATAGADDPATRALRAAAVVATCGLAGAQGAAWPTPLPLPAPDDRWPALDDGRLLPLLDWVLHEGPVRLQLDLCRALAQAERRLPPASLPRALELGRRSIALRAPLLPVLGERGLWLAAQRDDWRFAAGVGHDAPDETRWSEGSLDQRRALLVHERAHDPRAARERLAKSLAELPAKERADLIGVLTTNLSADDEPLLDSLRADRSREVRQAATALLVRLPGSSHAARAAARIEALLRRERALIRMHWVIDAPSAAADDWKADNVEATRPQSESLGERAWWLYQLVRQVPLSWWTRHTGMSAAELRDWADGTDWTEALLRGWRDVLFTCTDEAWCIAFLDKWPQRALRDDPADVLAMLPLAQRERYWQRYLHDGSVSMQLIWSQVIHACPAGETLSLPLSAALADTARQRVENTTLANDYSLRALLPELCGVLHPAVLDRLAQLPRRGDEAPGFADTLQAVTQVIAIRQALSTLPTARTT